jgi:hypothetical protein
LLSVNADVRIGDYTGIDVYNGKIIPVWTDDRIGTPNQEIYTAVLDNIIGVETIAENLPSNFDLKQNYPNPFNPVTTINYDLPKRGFVKLVVYDVLGTEVVQLVNEHKETGKYTVEFNGEKYTSGVYFYKLSTDGFSETKRMLLIK